MANVSDNGTDRFLTRYPVSAGYLVEAIGLNEHLEVPWTITRSSATDLLVRESERLGHCTHAWPWDDTDSALLNNPANRWMADESYPAGGAQDYQLEEPSYDFHDFEQPERLRGLLIPFIYRALFNEKHPIPTPIGPFLDTCHAATNCLAVMKVHALQVAVPCGMPLSHKALAAANHEKMSWPGQWQHDYEARQVDITVGFANGTAPTAGRDVLEKTLNRLLSTLKPYTLTWHSGTETDPQSIQVVTRDQNHADPTSAYRVTVDSFPWNQEMLRTTVATLTRTAIFDMCQAGPLHVLIQPTGRDCSQDPQKIRYARS